MPSPNPPPSSVPFGLGTSLVLLAGGLALFAYIIGRLLAEERARDESNGEPESADADGESEPAEAAPTETTAEHSEDSVV